MLMFRRLGHAVFAAFVVLFLLAQATLIIAWIPSAQYTAIAAGTAYRLVDSVNSTALRIDQLGAGAAVSGTDQIEICQACGASTSSVKVALSAVATYIINVLTGQQNVWSAGQQLAPFTLTDASSVAINFANGNIQTLLRSRSSSKIANPTGVSSGDRGTLTLELTQPSSGGPDDLTWDTGWKFPSGTPPIQANGGLCAANNCIDQYTCNIRNISGTIDALCPFNGSSNFASSSTFVLLPNHTCSDPNCSGGNPACTSPSATCSATILNTVPNALGTVGFVACCTTQATAPSVTYGGAVCTVDAAAYNTGATGGAAIGVAYCPQLPASTSAVVTVTWPASVSFPVLFVANFLPSTSSPLAGIGNTASSASGANPSISTNGVTTQTNQLVVAVFNDADTPTTSGSCTQLDKETTYGHNLFQYEVLAAAGTATCSLTATATNYDASITSFLHY